MIEYQCPRCHFTKIFTSKIGFLNAKHNSHCNFCKGINISNISGSVYVKNCPNCNKLQTYSEKPHLITAIRNNTICYSCNGSNNKNAKGKFWSAESKKKASETWSKKYKSGYISKSKGKIKPPMSDDQKQKLSDIFSKKYGGKNHWIHRSGSMNKFLKHRYNKKEFKFPSGKIVYVQGYEPYAISTILMEGIIENDIIVNNNDKPKIKYMYKGKEKIYYPDFYIPSKNEIIEVKSTYTVSVDLDKNKLKIDAAVKSGYNVRLMVFDRNKKMVKSEVIKQK